MRRNLLFAGACLGATGMLLGADTPPAPLPPANASPLTVSVDVPPSRFYDNVFGDAPLFVTLHVTNTSHVSQSFRVMSCSWIDEWKFSGTPVGFGSWACAANAPVTVTLAPGEEYKQATRLYFSCFEAGKLHPLKSGKCTFKADFTPIGSAQTYWSQPVTVELVV